jgi:RNA polymerase sigma factor (sigma-70 family)
METRKIWKAGSAQFNVQLNAFLKGDASDVNALFESIRKESIQIAKKVCSKRGIRVISVDDIAQDVCMKLWEKSLVKFDAEKGCFSGWLYTLVDNLVLTQIKNKKFTNEESYDSMSDERKENILDSIMESPSESVDYAYMKEAAIDCINVLTTSEKDVVVEIFDNPESIKEVGVKLGKDGNWVSGKKLRAVKKLNAEVKRKGFMD